MKKIQRNKITNIENTDIFDNKFLFEYLVPNFFSNSNNIEIYFLSDLLEKKKNTEILEKVKQKPAMYANVYSAEDELQIFTELFNYAMNNNKKIHIVWVTLKEEIEMLETYYEKLWFFNKVSNCFYPDFREPLITVSVNIENLIWRWSDYKAMREKIFFNPPVRESGQNKAMFKWINRWVTAWIHIKNFDQKTKDFLSECIKNEKILALTIAKVLKFNLEDIWFEGDIEELVIKY